MNMSAFRFPIIEKKSRLHSIVEQVETEFFLEPSSFLFHEERVFYRSPAKQAGHRMY